MITVNKTDSLAEIRYTPEFKRNLRALAKKYRNIRSDIQPIIEQIQMGSVVGDQIPETGDYIVFKVRVKNRDIAKGKRSGYRLVYTAKQKKKSYW